ncbi:type II toxin-antitoxin system RelE/ParE family toxin [Rhizobium giardinii]|uniref:type II toxin-antitoxin system RelE/ParE family toxin n=1 Tax=Rhizobium giardinii TaxID=56731 RepID=UPI0039DFC640
MKSRHNLLNVERQPGLTRVLENREAYLVNRIVAAVRRLMDFPASGRVGRLAGTRELVINGTPYVAAYAITETAVRILRVLHGAQEWPDTLPTS